MAVESVVTVSWLSRLKQSFGGMVFALGMVLAMLALLFWNEGRAVRTAKALQHGAGTVLEVASERIARGNEGKLVHVAGTVVAPEPVLDSHFGVAAPVLQLRRKVEMYQWMERRHTETQANLGGSETQLTRHEYEPQWLEQGQDSSRFKEAATHANPAMTLQAATFNATGARLGAWQFDAPLIERLGNVQAYPLGPSAAAAILRALPAGTPASLVEGVLYLAKDPAQPRIGDYRIRYEQVPAGPASMVGRQQGDGLGTYLAGPDQPLLIVQAGLASAPAMFDTAVRGNTGKSWLVRAVGIAGLVLGLSLLIRPLAVLGSVMPLLGSILAAGSGLLATVLGIGLGALTIAAAWFFHRPWLSLTIVLVGVALMVALWLWLRRGRGHAHAVQ